MDEKTRMQQSVSCTGEFRAFLLELVGKLSGEKDCEKRIATLLDAAIEYFGSDRAYVIEGDTELVTAVNTHERCAPGVEFQQDTLKDMPVEAYMRWLDVFHHYEAVVIEDMETMKDEHPGEYKYFTDSDVHSIIVVPFTKRINHGFVGVDNPTRNRTDSMTLRIFAYAIALELNEIKLIQEKDALMEVSMYPENIVHVHLLGDMKITARGGTIRQNAFTVQGHTILAIMFLNPGKQFSMDDLYDIISPARESDNPGNTVSNVVYKIRSKLDIIGLKELICNERGAYFLNPRFQVETDTGRFKQFASAMQSAESDEEKLHLGEEALLLYANPLPVAICNNIRLVIENSELERLFLSICKECVNIYMKRKEYGKALNIIMQALRNNPLETDLIFLHVRILKKARTPGLKSYVRKIESSLGNDELEQLHRIMDEKE